MSNPEKNRREEGEWLDDFEKTRGRKPKEKFKKNSAPKRAREEDLPLTIDSIFEKLKARQEADAEKKPKESIEIKELKLDIEAKKEKVPSIGDAQNFEELNKIVGELRHGIGRVRKLAETKDFEDPYEEVDFLRAAFKDENMPVSKEIIEKVAELLGKERTKKEQVDKKVEGKKEESSVNDVNPKDSKIKGEGFTMENSLGFFDKKGLHSVEFKPGASNQEEVQKKEIKVPAGPAHGEAWKEAGEKTEVEIENERELEIKEEGLEKITPPDEAEIVDYTKDISEEQKEINKKLSSFKEVEEIGAGRIIKGLETFADWTVGKTKIAKLLEKPLINFGELLFGKEAKRMDWATPSLEKAGEQVARKLGYLAAPEKAVRLGSEKFKAGKLSPEKTEKLGDKVVDQLEKTTEKVAETGEKAAGRAEKKSKLFNWIQEKFQPKKEAKNEKKKEE